MPARSVCLVALSLSEAGPGRFGRQVSVIDIYHTIPYHTCRFVDCVCGVRQGSEVLPRWADAASNLCCSR